MDEASVFERMVDSVACFERDGTIAYLNPVAGRLLGRTPAEVIGQNVWTLLPAARAGPFGVAFDRVVCSGETECFESSDPASGLWVVNHVYQVGGRVWVVARDITEQKLAAARLEILADAAQAFSEAASDTASVFERIARQVSEVLRDLCVVRLLSPDGQHFEEPVGLWDADPGCRELLQGTPAVAASETVGPEILRTGRPVVMISVDPAAVAARIAPSPRRDLVERLKIHSIMVVPMKARGQVLGILSVARRQTGTPLPYSDADLSLLEALADRAALVVSRWRTFELVEKSRAQLRIIGDSLPVLVSLVDRHERYVFVNATYQKWFGHAPETIVGRTLAEVLGPPAYEAVATHVRNVLAGQPVSFQTRVPYAHGVARDVEASYTPYVIDGQVEGFVALVADVTDRVEMEQSLKTAVAVRDEFLSIASHELRTPLAALQLQIDGTQRSMARGWQEPDLERARARIGKASRQIQRLSSLVDGLLNVSRISGGRFRLEPEEFDLSTLVAEVVERFEEEAARVGAPIRLQAPAALSGSWDRNRVDQVLTNLLSNALKYGEGKPVLVALDGDPQQVRLSVRDEGMGIEEANLDRIFGRFERAVSSRNYGGLGLGLYIARQIVGAHGGTIQVGSTLGQGATFTVTLPRTEAPA